MKRPVTALLRFFAVSRLNAHQTSAHLYKTNTHSQNNKALFALEDARSPNRISKTVRYRTSISASHFFAMVGLKCSPKSFSKGFTTVILAKANQFKLSISACVTADMRVGNALVPVGPGHEMVG